MPTVTLNKKVFEELVGKKLSLEQLKDRISMLGTDLEKIEGNEIIVEIFPNRPDMLSEQGFARAFSSFIGVKTGLRKYPVKKSGCKVIIDTSVTMRPYTACAIVKNLEFTDEKIREIMQIQEKLATTHGRNRKKSAYGIYPLHSINFPITYIAKDPAKVLFQPLGFNQKICAKDVPELHPKGKAYAHLTKDWKKYPFFIDAKDNVLCMLPFTNSNDTGKVETTTKEVFIECSGTDYNNIFIALNIIVSALADMGGEIYSLELQYENKKITTPNFTPRKIKFNLDYTNKILGLDLKLKEAQKLLEKMGYGIKENDVLIPAYRADILHPIDLIEDIAIAYGYENFPAKIPSISTIGQEDPFEKWCNKIRDILIGLGSLEVKNYHLMTADELNTKMNKTCPIIPLKNAIGDYNHLRNRLLPSILKNLQENQHQEYPQIIFEIGRTFEEDKKTETGIKETDHLALAISHEKTDFTQIRQILDTFFASLGVEYQIKESSRKSFIKGRIGNIILNNEKIGVIGELHPQVLTNWNLFMPTVAFELDLEKVFDSIRN